MTKNKIPISIVIRCHNDHHVFDCIKSIDEEVEVIVSMTDNYKIKKKLNELGIKSIIVPKGNLSITSNCGMVIAKNDIIIITDSDTVFKKNSIRNVYNALGYYDAARFKVIFQYKKESLTSIIVANARDFIYKKPLFFTPGVAIKKSIIPKIGNFLFNNAVPWAVDADLTYRMSKAKIQIKYMKNSIIFHKPIKLKHDIKAAFRIGMGVKVSVRELSKRYKNKREIKKKLKAVKIEDYFKLLEKKGILVMFYQILWDIFFFLGYYTQTFLKKYP